MKSTRAEGLSINVVIAAVIALIVLIVLILIFTGQLQVFTGSLQSCNSLGGKCDTSTQCVMTNGKQDCACTGDGKFKIPGGQCGTGMACCKQITPTS